MMNGREEKIYNDLFYTCSLIEYISRRTHNSPSLIVEKIGRDNISKILSLAEVYHSDNIEAVADTFIDECRISEGTFDNVGECKYSVPTHWDIGKVYKRLVKAVSESEHIDLVTALINVYSSGMVALIEDYNSSFYYDNPNLIFETYKNDCIPVD